MVQLIGGTCGLNGGKNKFGQFCNVSYNLDKDGRCDYHPLKSDKVDKAELVYNSIKSFLDQLIESKSIFATKETKNGKYIFYIKIENLWHESTSDDADVFILNSTKKNQHLQTSADDQKIKREFNSQSKQCVQEKKMLLERSISINNRNGMVYRFGDKLIDIDTGEEIDNNEDYNITDAFPSFIEHTEKEDSNIRKLIDSFGKGFIHFLIRPLYAPHRHATFIIGASETGKTTVVETMARCFVENGVARSKSSDFAQTRFNPVDKNLSENFAVMIDEAEKGKGRIVDLWDNIFNFLGRKVMSVELKGENTLELSRMGNPIFVGNVPPPINLKSDAVSSRISKGDVWIVGLPDLTKVVNDYKNLYTQRKGIVSLEDFNILINSENSRIKSVNGYYKKPFGTLDLRQWEKKEREILKYSPPYLCHLIVEALKSNYTQHDETMEVYYTYFSHVADLNRLAVGEMKFVPSWIEEEIGENFNHNTNINDRVDLDL